MTSIQIEPTNKVLSSHGGMLLFEKIIEKLKLDKHISANLPTLKNNSSVSSYEKFYQILMGFLAGAECLDDLDVLKSDKLIRSLHSQMFAANSLGDYLRSFSEDKIKLLNHRLIELSLNLRGSFKHKKEKQFILDLDSTDHEQHGVKMEDVRHTKDGMLSLNSIQAYDNYGFPYWFDLRPGATHTSVGAAEIISSVFMRAKNFYYKKSNSHFILRADSGYSNHNVMHACFTAAVKFVICMRSDMYMPLLEKQDPHWKKTNLKTRDNREFEIGEVIYKSKSLNEVVRVVLLRARREGLLEAYDYYGWATNLFTHDMQAEKIIRLYRGRGNAENFIRETKNNFDLKHFPCLKRIANRAFGLIGSFAHSLMRFLSYVENPFKPRFAKNLRIRAVSIACELVTHARKTTVRFMHHKYKEIIYWLKIINIKLTGGIRLIE